MVLVAVPVPLLAALTVPLAVSVAVAVARVAGDVSAAAHAALDSLKHPCAALLIAAVHVYIHLLALLKIVLKLLRSVSIASEYSENSTEVFSAIRLPSWFRPFTPMTMSKRFILS